MQWDDVGYLLYKNRYNENSIIAEFFTEYHGKTSGIIFGATSKKIKNYLQLGNKLQVNYNYKNESKLGYFKIEIYKVHTPYYFENKEKLLAILSGMNLIKLLTAESQENIKIFNLIDNFFLMLNNKEWIRDYIFWELKLLELVGFNLEIKKIIQSEKFDNQERYFVRTSSEKKYVPNFLVDKKIANIDKRNLSEGIKLVGDF